MEPELKQLKLPEGYKIHTGFRDYLAQKWIGVQTPSGEVYELDIDMVFFYVNKSHYTIEQKLQAAIDDFIRCIQKGEAGGYTKLLDN